MMKTFRPKAVLNETQYEIVRKASQTGRLSAVEKFARDSKSGEVTFTTKAPKRLCEQLEKLIDFGASSARDVLFN